MRTFPTHLLVPVGGSIRPCLRETGDDAVSLEYDMSFRLQPFRLTPHEADNFINEEGTEHETSLEFQGLCPPGLPGGYASLAGTRYRIPPNPDRSDAGWRLDGGVEGSVCLSGVHVPVNVELVEFGKFANQELHARLSVDIDFEYENVGFRSVRNFVFGCPMRVERRLVLDSEHVAPRPENLEKASAFMAQIVDLDAYEEPVIWKHREFVFVDKSDQRGGESRNR